MDSKIVSAEDILRKDSVCPKYSVAIRKTGTAAAEKVAITHATMKLWGFSFVFRTRRNSGTVSKEQTVKTIVGKRMSMIFI
jgi:hypothetical protein